VEDVSGRVIIPGLVDTHSHVGIYPRPPVPGTADGNEMTGPVQPLLRAVDAIWPADPGIRMAQAGGITTANIMPGSGNVMGGQTAYVKLRGRTIEEMLIPGALGGMKMANGENPTRSYGSRGRAPMTRMAVAALARALFVRAQEYQRKWQAYEEARAEGKDATPPERDLALEPVVEILERRRIVQHHTHRADDILTVARLAEEFGFRVVIQHGTEAYLVAGELARRNIPVSMIVIDSPGGKHEATQFDLRALGILERAGVKVAIHTDDFINNSRFFLREGALAVRGGMSTEGALRALTIHGAEMMDLADRLGTLEPGKDADLVVLSGEPFSVYTHVLATYIEGQKVFDRSRPEDRRYATGGFAVAGERYPVRGGGR
jgi:imidazolonepropionase-like amidohydrolase